MLCGRPNRTKWSIHRTNHEKYSGGLERTAEAFRFPGTVIAGTAWRQEQSCRLFCVYRGVLRRLRQGSSKWQRAAQKPLWGRMGKASFHGEKAGKSVVCLSANLQTGKQTVIPTDLETSKYSTKQQNFNLNGEYWEMFSALKASENNRTHTTVLLNHLHCSLLRYNIYRIDKVYCRWITGAF